MAKPSLLDDAPVKPSLLDDDPASGQKPSLLDDQPARPSLLDAGGGGKPSLLDDGEDAVDDAHRYVPGDTTLGKAIDTISYPMNVINSMVVGSNEVPGWGTGLDKALEYGGQAARKERRTNLDDVMASLDKVSKSDQGIGLPIWGKASTGEDLHPIDHPLDTAVEVGARGLDLGRELGIGLATDPVSWLTMGPVGKAVTQGVGGAISKGAGFFGKAAEDLGTLQKTVPIMDESGAVVRQATAPKFGDTAQKVLTGMGKALQDVTPGQGLGIGIGATIAGGTAQSDDPVGTLGRTAAGAAAMFGAQKLGPTVMTMLDKAGAKAYDGIATALKGEQWGDISAQTALAQSGAKKVQAAMMDILQSYGRAVEGIDESTLNATKDMMSGMKTEFIKRRNAMMMNVPEPKSAWLGTATKQAYDSMVQDGTIAGALGAQTVDVREAYEALVKHNAAVIKKVNSELYGLPGGVWDRTSKKGIMGIPFHVEDLRPLQDFADADKLMNKALGNVYQMSSRGPLKSAQSLERTTPWADLGSKESYKIYANQMAMNWATDLERKAMGYVGAYKAAPGVSPAADVMLGAGEAFDKFTGFLKYNLLFPSSSWIRNHYMENMKKAFMTNGVPGFVDAAKAPFSWFSDIAKDIRQIHEGDFITPFKRADSADLVKYGVVNTNFFRENSDALEQVGKYVYRPETLQRLQDIETIKNATPMPVALAKSVAKIAISPLTVVGDRVVLPLGQMVEGGTRARTFFRISEALQADEKAMAHFNGDVDAVKRFAAKVTNDTFFDYGAVNAFENAAAKKVYPFYTFFKNNLQYYFNSMQNPTKLGRLAQVAHLDDTKGMQPTKEEWAGLPLYVRNANPKIAKRLPNGAIIVHISPSDTAYEAIKSGTNFGKASNENPFVEKLNPLIKTPIELGTGKDLFTGGPLYPSDSRGGKKAMFGRGQYDIAQKNLMHMITPEGAQPTVDRLMGNYGVEKDEHGNAMASDDSSFTIDKLLQTGMPKPGFEQLANSIAKTDSGKMTGMQQLYNLFGPGRYVYISPEQMEYNARPVVTKKGLVE